MLPKKLYEFKEIIKEESLIDILSTTSSEKKKRLSYKPPLCSIFNKGNLITVGINKYKFKIDKTSKFLLNHIADNKIEHFIETKKNLINNKHKFNRKQRVGVVFSGGPAPGGHNVISGLFDALIKLNKKSKLFGFIMGPEGIIEGNYIELTSKIIDSYRNLGGFNMLKTGRTKIDTTNKINLAIITCKKLKLDALVVVGGDDSNTNAAFLAQAMFKEKIKVIGVPKTIDGDIQVKDTNNKIICATSFGFHSAATSFSHAINNLCIDAASDIKYWHICKIMGRVASHLALEVAFQTHPNITIIGEELADYIDQSKLEKAKIEGKIDYNAYGMTLNHLIRLLSKSIIKRAKVGKNFGVIVIPEGILEFINEIQIFIIKLNSVISTYNIKNNIPFHTKFKSLNAKLQYLNALTLKKKEISRFPVWNIKDNNLFKKMPLLLKQGLLNERDDHGNFQFSQVKTEDILLDLIKNDLIELQKQGEYMIGIDKKYYDQIMEKEDLEKEIYKNILFRNNTSNFLLFKKEITSLNSLTKILLKTNLLNSKDNFPKCIKKLFEKSIPNFKAQSHFYGYDGRGDNPTQFDCTYAYNLGQTAFHLINNNATGQMAGIVNLENDVTKWKPIGIPIANLMHIEEKKGNLSLVLEKSTVDLKSNAFQVFKILRQNWLGINPYYESYKSSERIGFMEEDKNRKPLTLVINNLDKKIKQ